MKVRPTSLSLLLSIMLFCPLSSADASLYLNNVRIQVIGNSSVAIGELLDRPLLIDAFASWCEPCTEQGKLLVQGFSNINQSYSLLSISISPESDNLSVVRKVRDDLNATWVFGVDTDLEFSSKVRPTVLPTLYLVDTDGLVIKRWEGVTSVQDILAFRRSERVDLPYLFSSGLVVILLPVRVGKRSHGLRDISK